MSIDDIEAEALKLDSQARARLAKKLLESLETLTARRMSAFGVEADRRDVRVGLGARFYPSSRRCASRCSGEAEMNGPTRVSPARRARTERGRAVLRPREPGAGILFPLGGRPRPRRSIDDHPEARRDPPWLRSSSPPPPISRCTPFAQDEREIKRRPAYWVGREVIEPRRPKFRTGSASGSRCPRRGPRCRDEVSASSVKRRFGLYW